jgi:hypothetical protein
MTTACTPERQTLGAWHTRVWALAGPIILSNLSTPLLGAVDTAVVGHLPDAAYIGGVAVGAVIFNFLYWGFGFLPMGTTGFTAQAFGAEDSAELRATLARPLLLAFALGALLIVLQTPVGWCAFALFEASDRVEDLAQSYYAVRIWSAPAALVNYAMLGWLLGIRRAGAVLLLQVVLNGINILLDLVFVLGLGWGIEGVALASLLAELGALGLGLMIVARSLKSSGGSWDWRRIASRACLAVLLRANLDIFVRTLCLLGASPTSPRRAPRWATCCWPATRSCCSCRTSRPMGWTASPTQWRCWPATRSARAAERRSARRSGSRPPGRSDRRGIDRLLLGPWRADRRFVHRPRVGAPRRRGLSALGGCRPPGLGLELSA